MEVNEIVREDMRGSQFAEEFLLKLLFLVKAERFWYGTHTEENTGGKRKCLFLTSFYLLQPHGLNRNPIKRKYMA